MPRHDRAAELIATTRSLNVFSDTLSGIPTVTDAESGRRIRELDAEQLSGALASFVRTPDTVEPSTAADTLLAMMRQNWDQETPEAHAMMINFTQRLLDGVGLKVVRADG